MTTTERLLRKDAQRNRQRILAAARELFARDGLSVTLNDVAHYADVGVGTVYRHFPDKALLIEELFDQELQEIVALLEAARAIPDPWQAVVEFHERVLELQAKDRGLQEILLGAAGAPERITTMRATLHPLAADLIERARAAGAVRADCETQDFGVVQLMVGAVIDAGRQVAPELWRRYLSIALQGLRPHGAPLDPLPTPAVSPEEMDPLLVAAQRARRSHQA